MKRYRSFLIAYLNSRSVLVLYVNESALVPYIIELPAIQLHAYSKVTATETEVSATHHSLMETIPFKQTLSHLHRQSQLDLYGHNSWATQIG